MLLPLLPPKPRPSNQIMGNGLTFTSISIPTQQVLSHLGLFIVHFPMVSMVQLMKSDSICVYLCILIVYCTELFGWSVCSTIWVLLY